MAVTANLLFKLGGGAQPSPSEFVDNLDILFHDKLPGEKQLSEEEKTTLARTITHYSKKWYNK